MFVLDHLDHFAVEMLRNAFITTNIPALKAEVENSDGSMNEDHPDYNLLCHCSNNPSSYMPVLRWVNYLGFKQDKFKKLFYVDGHEYMSQILHRRKFTTEYLTNLEPCSHRWVQIPADEYQTLISSLPDKDTPLSRGYQFIDPNTGIVMLEFHVDDHRCLQMYACEHCGEFGGKVSVRRPPNSRPVIIFGQDEFVFSQLSFNGMQWVGPSGKRSILPKNDGMGVMVSAFQSREFGWGMEITDQQMVRINQRQIQQDYFDKVAANEVHGGTKKAPLTTSPFVRLFEFGGKHGYWTGNHMILQTKDCIDCLREIFDEQYEFVFLYDHSSGHAKKRVGGLDAKNMNKGFGGQILRNSMIEEKDGYLGPFHNPSNPRMVSIGHEQTFV